jgi:putative SOS response-associated peptidase YedK
MCTRYISPETGDIERHWHIGGRNPWRGGEVFPNYPGPFIRAARQSVETGSELVVGQWSLIPWFAKERRLKFPTANARSEELSEKASYKQPWARGQRCIIPALAFFEPNWETGKHVPWIFRRADGAPWGLAGLWNTWIDKATGEIVESYTMLTINADAHPLMSRMHRPDPKRPPAMQDKRSVVPIEFDDVDSWLFGTLDQARQLLRLAPALAFDAAPVA